MSWRCHSAIIADLLLYSANNLNAARKVNAGAESIDARQPSRHQTRLKRTAMPAIQTSAAKHSVQNTAAEPQSLIMPICECHSGVT